MLWKKQPVGSKIADLQTNKASKDAATQSAAGLMSAADKTKLDGLGAKTYGMSIDVMTTIPSNTDLNTYTTPGSYYCPNAAAAATLSNSPVTNGGFSLHVESVGGVSGQNIIQTVKQFGTAVMNEFTRTYSPTTWSRWGSSSSLMSDMTLTGGTNITINWQRCKKQANGLTILQATFTPSANISAGATVLAGAANIGGNSQYFAAYDDSGNSYPLSINGSSITTIRAITSGTKIRFIMSYYCVNT